MLLTVDLERLRLRPGEKLLDAGCGEGRHCFGALERGAHVVGLDLDLPSLEAAAKPLGNRAAEANLRAAELSRGREQVLLEQTAHAAAHELSNLVRNIDSLYQQYKVAEQRRSTISEWQNGARARYLNPAKFSLPQSLDLYLDAIRDAVGAEESIGLLTCVSSRYRCAT